MSQFYIVLYMRAAFINPLKEGKTNRIFYLVRFSIAYRANKAWILIYKIHNALNWDAVKKVETLKNGKFYQ